MFAFYQLNCKNKVLIHPSSPLHYDIAIRINLKVTLAKGSFSQFLDVILTTNSIIYYLSFERERYRSRKCDFKCFSNVIKTAYINDKKNPVMLILLYLVRHFAHPCFNYSDITSITKNEQKQ